MPDILHTLICCCCCLATKSCLTLLRPHGLQPAGLFCPWDFPGKNTGVGFHFLLQGILLTQGSNFHLLNWQANSLPLTHQGSPHAHIIKYIYIYMPTHTYTYVLTHTHTISNIAVVLQGTYIIALILQIRK